jgi:hypothetical protein
MLAMRVGQPVWGIRGSRWLFTVSQNLAHLNTASREDAREYAGFERLALDTGQASK